MSSEDREDREGDDREPPRAPPPRATPAAPSARRALGGLIATTLVVTAASYLVPASYAATAVAVLFLTATWALVLRHDAATIRAYGLSVGGLLEPNPIAPRRLVRDALKALSWAALLVIVFFPPFWLAYRTWWDAQVFVLTPPASVLDEVTGQLLVVAFPEEAFFRGFLQGELDALWKGRVRVLGADIGWGMVVSAAVFAVGHVLTSPHPARLAVFFPALVFGWLRARTGGVGAGTAFHAACNLFSATLARGYGLSS
jgi:membrane protease YdiL (CAAX protease family)